MEEEEYVLSLDSYSKEIEAKIDIIISLRSRISSIETFENFIKDKTQIIQSLFETEDLLRSSCLFLRKNYFKHKKSLLIGSMGRDSECNWYETFPMFSTINPTEHKQTKNGFSECGTIDIQPPVVVLKEKEVKVNEEADSFMNQLETISYQLSTDKDHFGIFTENIKDKSSPKEKPQCGDGFEDFLACLKMRSDLKKESSKQGNINNNKALQLNDSFDSQKFRQGKENKALQAKNHIDKPVHSTHRPESNCEKINEKISNTVRSNNSSSTLSIREASTISNILFKLHTNKELYSLIVLLFNENILSQLIALPINQNLISSVEKAIKEVENLQAMGHQPKQAKQTPLNVNYLSFKSKSSQKTSREHKRAKKSNHSCSAVEPKSEGRIIESSSHSLSKKASIIVDNHHIHDPFVPRKKSISNKKAKVSYPILTNRPHSSHSLDYCNSNAYLHKSAFEKEKKNSALNKSSSTNSQAGKESAVKQYINSALKNKAYPSKKEMKASSSRIV